MVGVKIVEAQRAFSREYGRNFHVAKKMLQNVLIKFQRHAHGTVLNRWKGNSGWRRRGRSEENMMHCQE